MATHATPDKTRTPWGWLAAFALLLAAVLVGAAIASSHHGPTPAQQFIKHSQEQLNNAPAG